MKPWRLAQSFLEQCFITVAVTLPVRVVRHLLFLLRSNARLTDRWGYYVRPIHYYDPLPDFQYITTAEITRSRHYQGIDFNWPSQLELISELAMFKGEVQELASSTRGIHSEFYNPYFAGTDAAVYYALIRRLRPRWIVEIGGGYSTRIASYALNRNRREGYDNRLMCVEPYPESRLTETELHVELIRERVENVGLDLFSQLQANDILFIDSTHTVKFNSDVCYLLLDVVPQLNAGVWVHIHDIFFPHDYPREWLMEKRIAFNEQYLLEAFLSYNKDFVICLANHGLHLQFPSTTEQLWPAATQDDAFGAVSLWIRRLN
jgi:hypothetical protein